MKLGPVTKKIDDDAMSASCDALVTFPTYGQFGPIRKPDCGGKVCKIYTLIKSNLFVLQKLKTELKNL